MYSVHDMERSLGRLFLPTMLVLLMIGSPLGSFLEPPSELGELPAVRQTQLNVETTIPVTNYPNGTSNVLQLEIPEDEAATELDLSLKPHINPVSEGMTWSTASDWNMSGVDTDGVDFNVSSGMTVLPRGWDWDFETSNHGWSLQSSGGWSWGYDSSLGQSAGVHSGTKALYTYNGNYPNYMSGTHWATSPVMDCGGCSGNWQLSYWKRLGVEYHYYDHAYVQVKNPSGNWVQIFSSYGTINDGSYNLVTNSISSYISGNSNFQVRFGLGGTDGSVTYTGWNLDDVSVLPVGSGVSGGFANWTSAEFGPGASGSLKTSQGQYGLVSIDASASGGSSVSWDILDGTSKQPIYGFKERSELYADLGAIDWHTHPTIRLRLHMNQPSGTNVMIHSVNLEGRYSQTFNRNPSWSGSISWDGDSYPGSGTILSPVFESLRPISRVKTTAAYSGSGQLLIATDAGPFNPVSTSGGTHTFQSYAHTIQFKWQSTSSNADFRSVQIDFDSGGLPFDSRIDVGLDGINEWDLSHPNIGPWGWQDRLSTGDISNDFSFNAHSSQQVGIWLPTTGLDVMRFSLNPSSAGIQNLDLSLSVGGVSVFNQSFGTFSDSQLVTFDSASLNSLNTELAGMPSVWPSSTMQVGVDYALAVFTVSADYGVVNLGGISAVNYPVANLSYSVFDEMIWSINDLMPHVFGSFGVKKVPLTIKMTNAGSLKGTITAFSSTDEVSSDSMTITNATITLAPSYQWIEVNSTHTAPTGSVYAVQLDMVGSLHQVKILCKFDGTLLPAEGSTENDMIYWDGANGCDVDVNGTSVTSAMRIRLNASWDDEDELILRTRVVLNDGRRSVPITQNFGPGSVTAVENDVEVVSWEMYNDLGVPIPVDRLYLKANTPIRISVDLGFPDTDRFLAPRAGDVAVRVFENDVVVANSTALVNGSIDFNLVAPLSSQPIEFRVDVYPLRGQENISSITLNRTYEIDSLAPLVIENNIRKYDHLSQSLTQEIRVEIYDRPLLPEQLSLMLWRNWMDDTNYDGMVNETEFIEYHMTTPTDIEQARGNYTFFFDDTDGPNGGIVAGYVAGSDAAGNLVMGGGGPGVDEQLFTYQLAQDGAPWIVGTGGFSDGDHSWLHPATLYEISIPFDEPNGLSDLEDVRFQLASNSIVDSLEVIWNASTNRCNGTGNYLLVDSCHIHARSGEISPFTTELELRLKFTLEWGLPTENDLRRAPAITVRDRAGAESWLELPQLRWRFSPNLAILGESVLLEAEEGSVIGQSAWVRPGTGLNISGQVTFVETGLNPTLPFDVSILLDGERTIVSTMNGYFLSQLVAPTESKSHALSFELSGLPPEAVDGTDSTTSLFWIEVDGNAPSPMGVDAPREGTEISLADLSSVQIELILSEQEKLNVDTLQLFFKITTASKPNGPSLIEGSEPLNVSGSPVGQSISVSAVIDVASRLPEDAFQDALILSVWVKGSDMAGNSMQSSVQFNSGSTPFVMWDIEHLVADIDLTKLTYSRSGELDVGQTTMVTIELRNSGHAPGSTKLLAYEIGRDGENRSLTPVPVSVVVPMGDRVTYDIDWIPEDNGERWIIIALDDGSSLEGEHVNIIGESGDDPLGSALQDVPMTWIAIIAVLLLILTLVVSLALRSGGSSESALDDTDDWDDDWVDEQNPPSTYASPSEAMSALAATNQISNQPQQAHPTEQGGYQFQQQDYAQMQDYQQAQQPNQYQWTAEQIQAYQQQQYQQYYNNGGQPPPQ
ncbi:MAG: hypothetical protein QF807_00665 [Candidatus Thalassarchaeaceae archaeon]|nr:hypothetical protein [Candidatus Thalassarchaeaceae archaeon]MDP7042517.1 hypothetical protein [Candidatus Thalassarchaeaceae archaeon]